MMAVAETDVTKPRRIYVNWTSPSDRDMNGIITKYIVTCNDQVCADVNLFFWNIC